MPFAAIKICANCQYWNGPRKVSILKNQAEVRSWSDQGVCMNRRSANTKGKTKSARQIVDCTFFEKWDQLQ